ncbi:MAG: UPF0182 family membrane protein [Methermicoccaceae archaeon]
MSNRHLGFTTVFLLFLAFVIAIPKLSSLIIDYQWFASLGYEQVFFVGLYTKAVLFVVSFVLAGGILYAFWALTRRRVLATTKWVDSAIGGLFGPPDAEAMDVSLLLERAKLFVFTAIALFSFMVALSVMGHWDTVLRFLYQTPFGVNDPIFNHDLSLYVFTFPFLSVALNFVLTLLFIALSGSAIVLLLTNKRLLLDAQQVPIFFKLGYFLFVAVLAVKVYLGRYDILYSSTGVVYGAGYVDVHINQYLPVLISLVLVISGIAVLVYRGSGGAGVSGFAPTGTLSIVGTTVALIFGILIVGGVLSGVIQAYQVSPNELTLEEQYIEYNIEMTNEAYGLTDVAEQQYNVSESLMPQSASSPSIRNARLWDYRPLTTVYRQKQAIRTYYGFNSLDVDRYYVDGTYTQVWVGARELYLSEIGTDTWLNRHLIFTHGFGAVMSPVTDVNMEGGPVFYLENIPSTSIVGINTSQPRIYYGEVTNDYIITNTLRQEFDYPLGDSNVQTTYTGTGGISLEGLGKLIVTIYLGQLKVLTSNYITDSSKLHIRRNVIERTERIAPYLYYDKNPHVFLDDEGRTKWMVHMFVHSSRYPYSEPTGGFNYIRDSVKAVVDAYNGTVEFYVINEDPMLKTYMNIYPGVFKPYSEMPPPYRAHLRYSEDLFSVQLNKYSVYHMKDPVVFYNKEDRWQIPRERYGGNMLELEPYNVMLQLPGYDTVDFVLMMPFTPVNKDNMIAWMAVDQDYPRYGQLVLYKFPKDRLVYGPSQVEARIDQDEEVSQSITLWGQVGSSVIRGNLLVIPINGSIIYIEPLYIAAEQGSLPELKKVIAVYGERVAFEDTLEEAVSVVIGAGNVSATPVEAGEKLTLNQMLTELIAAYDSARQKLDNGDLEGYAAAMKSVDALLAELEEKLGAVAG